jgi:dTDP-4-amino-4,6-dideoxygalactose transaminase
MTVPVFLPEPLSWARASSIFEKFGNRNQLSNFGPLVTRLEAKLATLLAVDSSRVVVFSNCTDALAAAAASLSGHKKIYVPGFSFVATLRAAQLAGFRDVEIIDVDESDWASTLPSGIPSDDEFFIPVAPFGADPTAVAKKFTGRIAVIDAAASIGSMPDLSGMEVGHAFCFSLHATKVLGAGEGGFSVFGSTEWAEKARSWSNFGRTGQGFEHAGINAKMSEVQAAFCLSRLEEWDTERLDWRRAQSLAEELNKKYDLETSPTGFATVHPYWVVRLPSARHREVVEQEFSKLGVGSRRWWSVELSTLQSERSNPVSKALAEQTLGFPMFRKLDPEHLNQVDLALTSSLRIVGHLGRNGQS